MSAPRPLGGHRLGPLESPASVASPRPSIVPRARVAPLPPVAFNAPEPPRTAEIPVLDRPDASTVPAFSRAGAERLLAERLLAEADVETRPGPVRSSEEVGWRLRLPDGSTFRLLDGMLLGRNPERADGLRRIQVPDCELGVSREHVRVRVQGDLLTIEDLGSTNGTYLVDEDGRETRLPAGEQLAMPLGWSLDLANVRLELWAPSR